MRGSCLFVTFPRGYAAARLHPGLLYIAPQSGLTIPQPFGLPFFFTTAVTAVISLSSQRIISLMATAMNFAARQGNFAIEYQQ